MRRIYLTVVALLLMLCAACGATALEVRVGERTPSGAYCGSHAQLVSGRIDVKPVPSTVDINVSAFGSQVQCNDEEYVYDSNTHKAKLTHADDPNDCIGAALTQNHLSLDITYKPRTDVVVLDFGVMRIDCRRC